MVAVSVRRSCLDDIHPVLSNLARRTADEADLFLAHIQPEERSAWLFGHIADSIAQQTASTFFADTEPVLILTWTPEGNWWYTTTLATERYFQMDFLRLSKQHLGEVQAQLKADLVAYTRSKHMRTQAWINFLGFQFLRWDDDARLFIRPWPKT
jgi:hypothetical protein